MNKRTHQGFFSISTELIAVEECIEYDLFINSSSLVHRERYVRIFSHGEYLTKENLNLLAQKYGRLYIEEKQRPQFMASLLQASDFSDEQKGDFLKEQAISHLKNLFKDDMEFSVEVLNETIVECREVVKALAQVIQDYSIQELHQLIANLGHHDFYTFDHSVNASMYAMIIFKSFNEKDPTPEELINIGMGGILHDIGKLKIPTYLINKPGKLDDEEFEIVKQHPIHGMEMLQESNLEHHELDFEFIKDIIYQHHENYDGRGYPLGLVGEQMSLGAKIMVIADVFEAITTQRPYCEVLKIDQALEIMEKWKGKRFDPHFFKSFKNLLEKFSISEKSKMELEDDFDSSIPHETLPLKKAKEKFGKIIVKSRPPKRRKKK